MHQPSLRELLSGFEAHFSFEWNLFLPCTGNVPQIYFSAFSSRIFCRQEGRSHRARKRPCKRKPDYCVAWQIHLSYVDLRFCFLALRAVSLSLLFSFSYTYANVISILENMPIRGTIFGTSAFSMSKFTFPFSFRSQDSHCTGVTARCAVSISPYQWLSDYCLL